MNEQEMQARIDELEARIDELEAQDELTDEEAAELIQLQMDLQANDHASGRDDTDIEGETENDNES